jgi:TRAP-type C4-dicarboxylate transport system permease large subunit
MFVASCVPGVILTVPQNLRSIYPNKRRSGSVSEEEPTKDVVRSVQLLVERLILMVLLGGHGLRTL